MPKHKVLSILSFSVLVMIALTNCKNPASLNPGNDEANNPLSTLIGTWHENTDGTKLIFIVTNTYVAFQQPDFTDPTATVTYGSFSLASYDGLNIEILDHDDEIVTFTGAIVNEKLTLSGIDRIKWTNPPFEPRDFRAWNSTYVKTE